VLAADLMVAVGADDAVDGSTVLAALPTALRDVAGDELPSGGGGGGRGAEVADTEGPRDRGGGGGGVGTDVAELMPPREVLTVTMGRLLWTDMRSEELSEDCESERGRVPEPVERIVCELTGCWGWREPAGGCEPGRKCVAEAT
jgi:hypothetical protein